jgi:hypothetical protein
MRGRAVPTTRFPIKLSTTLSSRFPSLSLSRTLSVSTVLLLLLRRWRRRIAAGTPRGCWCSCGCSSDNPRARSHRPRKSLPLALLPRPAHPQRLRSARVQGRSQQTPAHREHGGQRQLVSSPSCAAAQSWIVLAMQRILPGEGENGSDNNSNGDDDDTASQCKQSSPNTSASAAVSTPSSP